jgi:hypothetical protein
MAQPELARALGISVRTLRRWESRLLAKHAISILVDSKREARYITARPYGDVLRDLRGDRQYGHTSRGHVCVRKRGREIMTVADFERWQVDPGKAPASDARVSKRRIRPEVKTEPKPAPAAPKPAGEDPAVAAVLAVLKGPATAITGAGLDAAFWIVTKARDRWPEVSPDFLASATSTIIRNWRKVKRETPLTEGLLATKVADEAGKWADWKPVCENCGLTMEIEDAEEVRPGLWRHRNGEICLSGRE